MEYQQASEGLPTYGREGFLVERQRGPTKNLILGVIGSAALVSAGFALSSTAQGLPLRNNDGISTYRNTEAELVSAHGLGDHRGNYFEQVLKIVQEPRHAQDFIRIVSGDNSVADEYGGLVDAILNIGKSHEVEKKIANGIRKKVEDAYKNHGNSVDFVKFVMEEGEELKRKNRISKEALANVLKYFDEELHVTNDLIQWMHRKFPSEKHHMSADAQERFLSDYKWGNKAIHDGDTFEAILMGQRMMSYLTDHVDHYEHPLLKEIEEAELQYSKQWKEKFQHMSYELVKADLEKW